MLSPRDDGVVSNEGENRPTPMKRLAQKLAFVLLLAAARPAVGQVVRGTVRDSSTGGGLEAALVVLLQNGDSATSALSGDSGAFHVAVPAPGVFTVAILRIGYQPFETSPMILLPADTVERDYLMQPVPFQLDPVVVRAEAYVQYLEEEGFYERQRIGLGHHVDPEWIEKRQNAATRVGDLMSALPGVSVTGGSRRQVRLSCGTPRIFVDDVRVLGGSIDDWVEAWNVLAIEIYRRRAEAPPRYGSCAIVIWTRYKAERRMIR